VTTTVVSEVEWPKTVRAIGSIEAKQGVVLAAEIAGRVSAIKFENGALAKAGDVLVELDTSVEKANLEVALARKAWAEKKLSRAKNLRATNAVSQDSLDDAEFEFNQVSATVASLQATIERKTIRAPFDGRTGIRMVNLGQYVNSGDQIVPLFSVGDVFLNFAVPQNLVSLIGLGTETRFTVDAFGAQEFVGTVTSINPQVAEDTRNVMVQATIPNSEDLLKDGMFARLSLQLKGSDRVIPVPLTSINFAPYGDSVYLVSELKDPAGKTFKGVTPQIVKLGERRGDLVAVISGLSVGQEIVTSGVFKLRPNAPVQVTEVVAPKDNLTPTVQNN
jgi:membrane fusion protein (multidrug efflux system)